MLQVSCGLDYTRCGLEAVGDWTEPSLSSLGTDSDVAFDELFEDVLLCLQPKKKRIRNRRRALFRVPRVDVRRQFCVMFMNMMNTQDSGLTNHFFDTFCTPDMQMKMYCTDMQAVSNENNSEISAVQVHVQSQSAVSKFFTLLQHFSPDLAITMENIELLTHYGTEEVTIRALMGVNSTMVYKTAPPLLAQQYLLASVSTADKDKGSNERKRKHDADQLPQLPWSSVSRERLRMQLIVQCLLKVDKEKRITSIDFSMPMHAVFEP